MNRDLYLLHKLRTGPPDPLAPPKPTSYEAFAGFFDEYARDNEESLEVQKEQTKELWDVS